LNIVAEQMDVRSPSSVFDCGNRLKADDVILDGLVYAAGINAYAPIDELDEGNWDEVFQVNVRGAFTAMRAFGSLLASGARLIFVGSTAALNPFAGGTIYCASKAALAAMAAALRDEWRPRGVQVTLLMPGSMPTNFWPQPRLDQDQLLPVEFVADLVGQILSAPAQAVLSDITVQPFKEI
jgi:3-oxoacyl-[acyl-carrier protein] reductase